MRISDWSSDVCSSDLEADRLELSLDVFAGAYTDASLEGWEGCGLAIQAYQKRSLEVIDFIADLARRSGRRIPVRLVKGAYWDTEIKRAQVDCHPGYRSEEHTSELQSLMRISYAVFCL